MTKEQTPAEDIKHLKNLKTFLARFFALLFFGMVGSGIGIIWGDAMFWLKMALTAFVLMLVTMLLYFLAKEVIKDEEKKIETLKP